jgi:hypothetical protein
LEFDNLRLSNLNIGTHCLCAQENTHEMPPKKRPGKELPVEASSQAAGAQVLKTTQTTTQPQTSTEPQQATVEIRRPEEPLQQPPSQAEELAMTTSAPTPQHPIQQQDFDAQEDLHQDSEEEIEAIIEDELACLHQENEPCNSCKSRWPEEKQWPREPRLCSNRSNKNERLRRSCNRQ